MAPRYVIRTIDEDWIDVFDPPSRIDDKRTAWDEAKRRVRVHPDCKTVVIDRYTGVTLWQSDPDIPARYEVVAVDATVFHALETGPFPPRGRAVLPQGEGRRLDRVLRGGQGTDRGHHPAARHHARADHRRVVRRRHLQHRRRMRRVASVRLRRRDGRCGIQREGWARRFATGLPCRARCAVSTLRAGIPRASARKLAARSACQEGRSVNGGMGTPPDVCPLSHTCSLRQPCLRQGPPLR